MLNGSENPSYDALGHIKFSWAWELKTSYTLTQETQPGLVRPQLLSSKYLSMICSSFTTHTEDDVTGAHKRQAIELLFVCHKEDYLKVTEHFTNDKVLLNYAYQYKTTYKSLNN